MSRFTKSLSKILPNSIERGVRTLRDKYFRNYKIEKLPEGIFDKNQKFRRVSLCTTCMNRLFHLRHTLEKNILDNINYPDFELVLIDYNSQDGLEEHVKKHFSKWIDKGLLNYYKTYEPQRFNVSKAKNLAHLLATGDIVCNLDGDNFTGKDFIFYLNHLYNLHDDNHIFQFNKAPFWGTVGRISMSRNKFMELGGYDEDFQGTGNEDLDLILRGKATGMGFQKIEIENFLRYLSNTTLERAVNCTDENVDYYELESINRELSNKNLNDGRFKANGNGWSKFSLYRNFSDKPFIQPYKVRI